MRIRIAFALFLLGADPGFAGPLDRPKPYLATPLDLTAFVPPPPTRGTFEDRRDREVFRHGRPTVGSERWKLATSDADEAVPPMMRDFSDVAGIELSPDRQPGLARLLASLRLDSAATNDLLKERFHRPRPFLRDPGPVCQDKATLATSFDYPSGHTAWGTSVALILAELLPSRAAEILARGRSYGDSRIFCGAHSSSAVAAGRQVAAGLVAGLHGSARFRADLDAARSEMQHDTGSGSQ